VKETIESKKIEYVWHFTRLANLDGILTHGLINRQSILKKGLPSEFNDDYRFDECEDSICCSIGHPNYKMFYSLRQDNPDSEWVVIVLQPSVLWEKDCAFCATNAASNEVTCIPIQHRKGIDAFNKLFDELPGKPPRNELGISESCPTDPQAEVLVFGDIEPKYIVGVVTKSKQTETALKAKYPNFEFLYHRALFSARKDYQHWK
jgi:hypothetical protein